MVLWVNNLEAVICYNLFMSNKKSKKSEALEKELYEPIKEYLEEAFKQKFGSCHLETTANGVFSGLLKSVIRHDIIFSFMGKAASPDLAGFIFTGPLLWSAPSMIKDSPSIKDFITVEIKRGKITPQDIYQAKMYGDLFSAKYALLISSEPIPEELRRLDEQLTITGRFMSGWVVYIGEWTGTSGSEMYEYRWLPHSPFKAQTNCLQLT